MDNHNYNLELQNQELRARAQQALQSSNTEATTLPAPVIKSDRWVFTLNNPTETDIQQIQAFFKSKCKFAHYQAERGKTTNTLHLQGFFTLASKSQVTLQYLHRNMLKGPNYSKMKGSLKDNLDYCTKTDTRTDEIAAFTHGEIGTPGVVAIKANLKNALTENKTLKDFKANEPDLYCRYINGVTRLYLDRANQEIRIPPLVCWFYGETGTGKTRTAITLCEKNHYSYWISGDQLKWFDGYEGQDVVILDDFRKMNIDFHFLLRLLDRNRLAVQVKNGFAPFTPKVIILTSPTDPRTHYEYTDMQGNRKEREDIGQLLRRIHHTLCFNTLALPNVYFIKRYIEEDYKKALQQTLDFIQQFDLDVEPHTEPTENQSDQYPLILSETEQNEIQEQSEPIQPDFQSENTDQNGIIHTQRVQPEPSIQSQPAPRNNIDYDRSIIDISSDHTETKHYVSMTVEPTRPNNYTPFGQERQLGLIVQSQDETETNISLIPPEYVSVQDDQNDKPTITEYSEEEPPDVHLKSGINLTVIDISSDHAETSQNSIIDISDDE